MMATVYYDADGNEADREHAVRMRTVADVGRYQGGCEGFNLQTGRGCGRCKAIAEADAGEFRQAGRRARDAGKRRNHVKAIVAEYGVEAGEEWLAGWDRR